MIENLEKIRKKLLENKKECDENCAKLNRKVAFLKKNTFEEKLANILEFGVLNYIILLLGELGIVKFGVSLNASIIKFLPVVVIFGSLGLGALEVMLLNKKYRVKEKFRNISKADRESLRLEEITEYNMQIEKIDNRRKIYDKAINYINKEIEAIKVVSNNYEVIVEEKKESLDKDNLVSVLDKEFVKFDSLIEKETIRRDFGVINDRVTAIMDMLMATVMTCMFTLLMFLMPIFVSSLVTSFGGMFNLMFFGPLVLGLMGSGVYHYVHYKVHKEAYQNLKKKYNLDDGEKDINLEESLEKISHLIIEREEEILREKIVDEVSLEKEKILEEEKLRLLEARECLEKTRSDSNDRGRVRKLN